MANKTCYGISMYLLRNMELKRALHHVAQSGFRQIEFLCYEGPHLDALNADPEKVRTLLVKLGLSAPTAHTICLGVDPGAPDEKERRDSVRRIAAVLESLVQIGTEYVVVHPTADLHNHYTDQMKDAVWSQSVRSLGELSELVGASGLKMAVENLQLRGRPRPGCFVAEVLEMIEGLGDHVGICLDTGHAAMNGLDAVAELRLAGNKLFSLHLNGNDGEVDHHWLPGRGIINWETFVATLDELNFGGPRMLEINATKGEETQLLRDAADLTNRWLS